MASTFARTEPTHHEHDEEGDDDFDDPYDEDHHGSWPAITDISRSSRTTHTVRNAVSAMQDLELHKRTLHQDRNDRATSEQVLDPRTRLILFKMLRSGCLEKLDGCLSTGKEANVYYAKAGTQALVEDDIAGAPQEYAIKIYKTSILVFKDRDKYVTGEHRWRKGYCKSNPRKMVKTWAEKEMRNYRRIWNAGIPCPRPLLLQQHVLLMEFLGHEGWPSPRLKDAVLTEKRIREAYVQCVRILRHLFQRCRLVHGDLSEYNLLWHDQRVFVIDVSQSVETDHPAALDFLRKDIANVNDFFRKVGRLNVMTTRQCFEFVTMPFDDDSEELELQHLQAIMDHVEATTTRIESYTDDERRQIQHQDAVDEAVFMSSFLPRSLNQVADHEIQKLEDGEVEETYAQAVASLTGNKDVLDAVVRKTGRDDASIHSILTTQTGGVAKKSNIPVVEKYVVLDTGIDENSSKSLLPGDVSEDDISNEVSDSDEDDNERFIKVPRTAEELAAERDRVKALRKANKKMVKESNSEKRKVKIKKKDKKKAIKKSKSGNRSTR